jgi:hypothetical protein
MTAPRTQQTMKLHTQEIVVLSTASGRNCQCTGHRIARHYRRATDGGLGCCVLHLLSTVTSCSCCVLPELVVFAIGLAMASGLGGFDFEAHWLLETKEDFFEVAREKLEGLDVSGM